MIIRTLLCHWAPNLPKFWCMERLAKYWPEIVPWNTNCESKMLARKISFTKRWTTAIKCHWASTDQKKSRWQAQLRRQTVCFVQQIGKLLPQQGCQIYWQDVIRLCSLVSLTIQNHKFLTLVKFKFNIDMIAMKVIFCILVLQQCKHAITSEHQHKTWKYCCVPDNTWQDSKF